MPESGPFPLWSFREDVYVEPVPHRNIVVIHNRWEDTSVPTPGPAVLEVLRRMSLGPISLDNVALQDEDRRELFVLLDRLQHLVVRSFGSGREKPLISVVPLTPRARFVLPRTLVAQPVRLSRFALLRTDGTDSYIESPLSLHRVIVHQAEAMAQVGTLIRPVVPEDEDQHSVIMYLLAVGMAVQAEEGEVFQPLRFAEDLDPALLTWSPYDLMFHSRSALGRHDADFGMTYPLGEERSVEPVVKPRPAAAIELPRPTWQGLMATDPPLTVALEAVRFVGRSGKHPLTAEELGELLYRTVRVRALIGSSMETSTTATSDRPYTSSGDCYELELYATVDRCVGVPRGVYHYDPFGHRLEPITADPDGTAELLETGREAASLPDVPPVLLTVTARFRRLSWKYNGLSHTLVLKNVGALTQALALVSTAMGLTFSRVDNGDTETVPRVLGLDWRVESGVGGFAVGHGSGPEPEEQYAINDADWSARAREALT